MSKSILNNTNRMKEWLITSLEASCEEYKGFVVFKEVIGSIRAETRRERLRGLVSNYFSMVESLYIMAMKEDKIFRVLNRQKRKSISPVYVGSSIDLEELANFGTLEQAEERIDRQQQVYDSVAKSYENL